MAKENIDKIITIFLLIIGVVGTIIGHIMTSSAKGYASDGQFLLFIIPGILIVFIYRHLAKELNSEDNRKELGCLLTIVFFILEISIMSTTSFQINMSIGFLAWIIGPIIIAVILYYYSR